MRFYLGLFTPYTWFGFRAHGATVFGVRRSLLPRARQLKEGDTLIGYLSRVSRWCGIFQVAGSMYSDTTPLFVPHKDKYILRVPVRPVIVLDPEFCVPITETWDSLNRTRNIVRGVVGWATKVNLMSSLADVDPEDGLTLTALLKTQAVQMRPYQLRKNDQRVLDHDGSLRQRDLEGDPASVRFR